MDAKKIEVGQSYQTKVGIFWKTVTVETISTERYLRAGLVRYYLVRSPAGNLLVRSNRQLRPIQPVTKGRLSIKPHPTISPPTEADFIRELSALMLRYGFQDEYSIRVQDNKAIIMKRKP